MKTPAASNTVGGYHIALEREAHTGAENLTKPYVVETRVSGEVSKNKLETESRFVSRYKKQINKKGAGT